MLGNERLHTPFFYIFIVWQTYKCNDNSKEHKKQSFLIYVHIFVWEWHWHI